MDTLQVDILNPKASRLLKDLASLGLIAIRPVNSDFLKVVEKFRANAGDNAPSLAEITKEVELVRSQRHAKKTASDNR